MGGASRLRNAVEEAGGSLEVSLRELRDAFGISRLTAAGRERIARELGAKGLRLEPPMPRLALDERVMILDPRPRPVPIAADHEPVQGATPGPQATPRRPFWSNRRRAVVVGGAIGLLVILLAAVFGANTGKEEPQAEGVPSPQALVSTPSAATTEGRSELLASLREVDAAAA